MKHVAADAIRVDGGWIVDIPTSRVRVCVSDLSEVDDRVGGVLGRLNGNGRHVKVTVDITRFLHVDDCSPVRRRQLLGYRPAEGSGVAEGRDAAG